MLMRAESHTVIPRDFGAAYVSYPPAFVLIPLMVARWNGSSPQLEDINRLGSLFQLFTAILAATFVFLTAFNLGAFFWAAFGLGTLCSTVFIFSPSAFFYFPFAWWADVAGLLPFMLLLVLECVSEKWRKEKSFRILNGSVIVAGVFTDWLFFFLLAAFFLKDLSSRPRRWRPEIVAIPAVYGVLHLLFVVAGGQWQTLIATVLERIGLVSPTIGSFAGVSSWLAGYRSIAGLMGYLCYL
ncbi:MAG TPA: hypothetical protein VIH99_08990, partial [Bdellovibrionota bacterium]